MCKLRVLSGRFFYLDDERQLDLASNHETFFELPGIVRVLLAKGSVGLFLNRQVALTLTRT